MASLSRLLIPIITSAPMLQAPGMSVMGYEMGVSAESTGDMR